VNPSDNDPTKDWFNSIPDTSSPPPLPNESHKVPFFRKKGLIVLLGIIIVAGISGSVILSLQPSSGPARACLSADDYAILTGSQNQGEQYSSEGIFHTTAISFNPGTTTYTKDTESASKVALKKVATFYESYRSKASITLTISADYYENDSADAANSRITTLRNYLTQNGVNIDSIHTNPPAYIDTSDELEDNSDEFIHATAYVSLSSDDQCKEIK